MSPASASKVAIVIFEDGVSKETIEKHITFVEANGGKIKDRYYLTPGGLHGFSATIQYYASFASFQADEVKYIQADQEVHI